MIRNLMISVALVSIIPSATSATQNTFSFGPCPFVKTKSDFDVNQYLGLWYEHQRFPNAFEDGLSCVQAFYSIMPSKFGILQQVNITNAGLSDSGVQTVVEGTAVPILQSGMLKVRFNNVPIPAPYKVLDTDYTSYASVYGCANFFLFKLEFAWVLVRDSATVTAAQLAAANQAFTKNKVKTTSFTTTKRDGCNYVLDSSGRRRP